MTAGRGLYGGRRMLEGTVVSDKTEKTVVVAVKSSVRHPLYKKIVRRVRKFMAHDDHLEAHMGDVVRIVESRPMSKRKRWRVVEVLFRADLPEVAAEDIDLELLGEVKVEEEEESAEVATSVPTAEVPSEAVDQAPEEAEDAGGAAEPESGPEMTAEVEEPAAVDEAEDEVVEAPAEAAEGDAEEGIAKEAGEPEVEAEDEPVEEAAEETGKE